MLVMIFMNSPNHFQATSDLLFHFPLILLKRILLWFDIYKLLCRMVNKLFLGMKIKKRAGHWSSLNCRVSTSLCQAIVILLIFVLWSAVREVETFISGLWRRELLRQWLRLTSSWRAQVKESSLQSGWRSVSEGERCGQLVHWPRGSRALSVSFFSEF